MIDLYYWPTPNGWKISIMLEECGLPYRVVPVNIGQGDQFKPEFLAISPNNRMPAIVDPEGPEGRIAIFESGAILCYLAEKSGRFLPHGSNARVEVLQWLYWQVGGFGPMAGQLSHFVNYAPEPNPYAHDRYAKEYDRLIGVMDRRLADREFLAGGYSIADMATWPWLLPYKMFDQSPGRFSERGALAPEHEGPPRRPPRGRRRQGVAADGAPERGRATHPLQPDRQRKSAVSAAKRLVYTGDSRSAQSRPIAFAMRISLAHAER